MSRIPVRGWRIKKNRRGSDRYADGVTLREPGIGTSVPTLVRYEQKCQSKMSCLRTFATIRLWLFFEFSLAIYVLSTKDYGVITLIATKFLSLRLKRRRWWWWFKSLGAARLRCKTCSRCRGPSYQAWTFTSVEGRVEEMQQRRWFQKNNILRTRYGCFPRAIPAWARRS